MRDTHTAPVPSDHGHRTVCVIGAGPRGLSVLERLCANERTAPSPSPLTIHLVDPHPPGAGAVWRTDQSRHLLMNTVTSQVTVFTDDSVRIDGPIAPGPSLYEWARTPFGAEPGMLAEAAGAGPDSYPTRAFYGAYLQAMFRGVVDHAPEHVTVRVHRTKAVALSGHEAQQVRLADGSTLDGLDAVVLALGHVPAELTPQERQLTEDAAALGLGYLPPGNPADADLSGIRPGEHVLLRGLGLNFFDHLALLTEGRGGTFAREGGRLVYRASGKEPVLYASSRRGVPYQARGENQKGAYGRYFPKLLTAEYVGALRQRETPLDFRRDLWPLIAREVESVYYGALLELRGRPADREPFAELYLAAEQADHRAELLHAYGIDEADHWHWDTLARPCEGREFADRAGFRSWLLGYLEQDLREARAGNVRGPLKAALDVLRDLRNEIRLAVDHGGLAGGSHREDLERWYSPLNAFLSIGPPAARIEQMIALIEAGVLELTGPGTTVEVDAARRAFVARSGRVPGPEVVATVLIEARLPEPDLRRTTDPLLRHLLDSGQAVPYRTPGADGHQTGGLHVTDRPYRVVDAAGRAHPHRFAYGVPTEGVHWVTAAGTRPGVDSVTLGDSDAIARAILALHPVEQQETDRIGASA
ncbi:FAD/NAD(P)-binding protein [Kitasatospora sp. NPDC096147]|uniref:FAD/NAD(P)-binding protein n=1 Tax=Kitasatospora sp. NPDC096147 TaxID=3364093 RepID=UPI00382CB55D